MGQKITKEKATIRKETNKMVPRRVFRYLDMALKVASSSKTCSPAGYSMGCVLVKNGDVIATGCSEPYNAVAERISTRHSDIFDHSYFSLHAEVDAVTSCKIQVKKAWAFINGLNIKSGNHMINTKPCQNCFAILEYLGIRAICYLEDGKPTVRYCRREKLCQNGVAITR